MIFLSNIFSNSRLGDKYATSINNALLHMESCCDLDVSKMRLTDIGTKNLLKDQKITPENINLSHNRITKSRDLC